ncbi:MAG: TonB-dependent receptor [gamma proteobacterium symbiont of Taylorina sp.]|nr:TonB-dependent receptor [gamma proteobacterium symbiont of Taylorina sp.]
MSNQSHFVSITSILSLFLYSILSYAESIPPEYSSSMNSDLPQIVVTATRTANTVDETIAPVTIITREDIERSQASSLIDVLRTAPGVNFTSNGGMGSTSGISIRGTNIDHVLYLIDGVPVRSATSGSMTIEFIPLAQIERIEVVRGPRSSLYGSDAIGGVVQLFTTKNKQEKISASIGYGSDNTRELTGSYSTGSKTTSFSAGISILDTDGYDFFGRDSYGMINTADKDDDGYENYSMTLNASHSITSDLELSGFYLRSQGESEFDGYATETTHLDFTEQVFSGTLDYAINEIWQSQLQLSRSYDKQYNYLHKLPAGNIYYTDAKSHFNTRTDLLNWQNDFVLRDSDLMTIGIDYKNDKVDSSTDFSEDSRWNKAIYGQYLYYGDIFDTQVSVRSDDNESFGTHNTWSFATGFALDDAVRVTTSYGTAFKAPSFNDLYWPADFFFKGNPDLKPEESSSFDFGVEITTGKTLWSAHYFDTEVDNLITYVDSYPDVSMMENVSKASIDGFELTVNSEILGFEVTANVSFVNPLDQESGKILARRSKRNINISVDKSSGQLSYGASIIASSERYNKVDEQERLAGFGLLNIRSAWRFNKHWTVKAKIDNLLDKDYVLTQQGGFDYKQPDRFAFASIHYQM